MPGILGRTAKQWLGGAAVVAAVAVLLTGCGSDGPLGMDRGAALQAQAGGSPAVMPVSAGASLSEPAMGACGNLKVPAGNELAFRTYARGVQIYRWNGTTWSFVSPLAGLFADEAGRSVVGTHYAGPKWESISGSIVTGALADRCTADPNAIPWLLLRAVSSQGPGVFNGVTFIQRVATVGGTAPAAPGSVVGEEANVYYTAEYYFYKAQ